jgi:hypothetical protein
MKQAGAPALIILLTGISLGSGLLTGCSNPREDVRVRLCKDLVAVQLGIQGTIDWTGVRTETPGYDDARVQLQWSTPEGSASATCAYPYNAVEDTAQQLAEPLSAYATSPSEAIIDGQRLSGQALANAIAKAMQRQGRELIDSANQALR